MKHKRFLLIPIVLALMACGSKKEGDGAGDKAADVTWPAKPADGTPVVFEFVEMVPDGKDLGAKMRLFNFSDKKVISVNAKLDYLDASGKKLKDFPWGMSSPSLIDAKGYKEDTVGAFIPAETKKVTATVHKVVFDDKTEWEATR